MKKETYKNVILILLIVSSFVLTVNIWFVKELWSDDYSSFLYSFQNIFNNQVTRDKTTDELIARSESSPAYITLTLNSKKIISYLGSDTFLNLEEIFSEIMNVIVKDGNILEISDDDFLAAHKTNSMSIRFMTQVNLSEYIKKDDIFFDLQKAPSVTAFLISVTDTKHLYFKDEETNKNYRIPIIYDDRKYRDGMQKILDMELTDSFAFEINMDKKKPEVDLILFDSLAPMNILGSNISKLEVTPVLNYQKSYDAIFKTFNISKNSVNIYTDKENVINFMENHSTFKILNDSSFIYEANKQRPGIPLSGDDELYGVVRFVNLLYSDSLPDSDGFLRLETVTKNKDETIYSFGYITKNGVLYLPDKEAVTLTVRNGHVVYYKQFLYLIKQTNNFVPITDFMKAYDSVYKLDSTTVTDELKIKKIFPANIYPDKIGWLAELSDKHVYPLN